MKINDSKNGAVNLGVDKTAVEKAASDKAESVASNKLASTPAESKSADNVTLSPMAQQIKSIQSKIATDSVFDAEKVNEIKSAIASGQFKVDSEKVADGLIQSVKDLLANKT